MGRRGFTALAPGQTAPAGSETITTTDSKGGTKTWWKKKVGEDFTATQKLKLEQAGLSNVPREQQLDFLFGDEDDPFAIGRQFIFDNPNASRAELKAVLLDPNQGNLNVSQTNTLLDEAGIIEEKQQFTQETLSAIATGLVDSFKGGFLGFFADEEEGKRKAIEVVENGTIRINDKDVKLSSRQIAELVEIINNL